jgi:NlpC/P60 family putative phage cell wall peptidase
MTWREAIVKEARTWIGTPFHHQGRMKGAGCDCIGMVLGALHRAGARSRVRDSAGNPIAFTDFDQTDYAPDPNSQRLKETLDRHLEPVNLDKIAPGDVLLFRVIHLPQHVGIVADHPMGGLSLIHAYSAAGKVVEETLSHSWITRVIASYRVPPACFGGA